MNTRAITSIEIEAAKTAKGGWTRSQLVSWGVSWPPPKGWKEGLLKVGVPIEHSKIERPSLLER